MVVLCNISPPLIRVNIRENSFLFLFTLVFVFNTYDITINKATCCLFEPRDNSICDRFNFVFVFHAMMLLSFFYIYIFMHSHIAKTKLLKLSDTDVCGFICVLIAHQSPWKSEMISLSGFPLLQWHQPPYLLFLRTLSVENLFCHVENL